MQINPVKVSFDGFAILSKIFSVHCDLTNYKSHVGKHVYALMFDRVVTIVRRLFHLFVAPQLGMESAVNFLQTR